MRKSRIPEAVKKEWNCVRCWTSRLGYTPFKPREFLDQAIVILRHDFERDEKTILHPMNEMVGYIQALQFQLQRENKNNAKYEPPVVLLVEFSKLLSTRYENEEKKTNDEVFLDDSLDKEFTKRAEKRVARFLDRLNLRNTTIVAHGAASPFALKLFKSDTKRSLNKNFAKRLLLLHPTVPPKFINQHLLDTQSVFVNRLKNVELHCAYASEREMRRRDAVLRHYCPDGTSITWDEKKEVNEAILKLLTKRKVKKKIAYDEERVDNLGRRVFFSELRIEMDPDSKMHVQICDVITREDMKPRAVETKEEEEDSVKLNLKTCVPECGALILRGNRVVLCRSLEDGDDPTVMHIPSCELDTEDEEDPLSCALRAVYEKCEIDEPEENITYLSQLPPMRLFSPRKVVDVYFFYANNPPPSIDDTSEEEDFEDAYVVFSLYYSFISLCT